VTASTVLHQLIRLEFRVWGLGFGVVVNFFEIPKQYLHSRV